MTNEELKSVIIENVYKSVREGVKYPATKQGRKNALRDIKHLIKQQGLKYFVRIEAKINLSISHGLKIDLTILQNECDNQND